MSTPSTTPIRVAVIGTGFGQKVHIPGFQKHHRTQVVAVYHHQRAMAQQVATAHQIPAAYDSIDELLQHPELDAVSLATPPFLHYEMGKAILRAGKHLLLEKPTALTVAEAQELAAIAQAQNLITTMDFEYRFVPAWQYLAEQLATGFIGQPRLIRIDWLMSSRANPDRPWNWYAQKALGGGALGALGSHTFDYVDWLFSRFGKVARLSASLNTSIVQRPDPQAGNQLKPVDSDDVCAIHLELTDGTPCHISLSSTSLTGRGHWVEVYGDRGTLILGSSNQQDYVHGFELWGATAGAELQAMPIPDRLQFPQTFADGRLAPFLRVVDCWVTGIDRGQAFEPSLNAGVYSQQLMDLTHVSHQQRQWVDVPS